MQGFDPGPTRLFVLLRCSTGHADGADAAPFSHNRQSSGHRQVVGQTKKGRIGGNAIGQNPARRAQQSRSPSLFASHFRSQKTGSVHPFQAEGIAAVVDDGDGHCQSVCTCSSKRSIKG